MENYFVIDYLVIYVEKEIVHRFKTDMIIEEFLFKGASSTIIIINVIFPFSLLFVLQYFEVD
jgi:hypothetical protein